MPAAPLHPHEDARLALLRALELLDSPPEEGFDAITRLASRLLQVPIALVSLVDADRQWFKSRVGLEAVQTPRDQAFCAHAILGDEPLVVEDAERDPRFADNPLVLQEPHIRFYAGVPLTTREGLPLGTLCVIDSRPRALGPEQRAVLQDLAVLARREILQRQAAVLGRDASTRAVEVLARSESLFRTTFEQAGVGMAMVSLEGRWIRVNAKLCEILGYEEPELLRLPLERLTHPDEPQDARWVMQRLLEAKAPHVSLEKRYLRRDGQTVWGRLTVSLVVDAEGRPDCVFGIVEDVTARKQAEAALAALREELEQRVQARTHELRCANERLTVSMRQREEAEAALRASEAELRAVLENATDAYVCVDADGRVQAWNRQAERLFGWPRDEVLQRPLDELIVPPEQRSAHAAGLGRLRSGGPERLLHRRVEMEAVARDGRRLPVELSMSQFETARGRMYFAFLTDISERRALLQSLQMQARHDALTGLPNRRELMDRLPRALARAERSETAVAVLLLDLDGFKAVNDRLGHEAGDQLLQTVARDLAACVRTTDTVARLAGDEFVVVLEGLAADAQAAQEDVRAVAGKIAQALRYTCPTPQGRLAVTASVGWAVYRPGEEATPATLLQKADEAMYRAKRGAQAGVI